MFTVDDLLAIFQYLKDKSNFLELEEVFQILSESEREKVRVLFTTVIDQIVHSTEDYKRLRKFLIDWYSTHRTLTTLQSQISDVYALPESALDELLLSLGYNFLNRPLFTKQKFLLELIKLYKGKGTANTIIKLLEFLGFTDVDLVEYWLTAIPIEGGYGGDFDLIFRSETVSTDTKTATKWPDLQYDDVVAGDAHWMLSKDEMKNLILANKISIPTKTPYFSYRPNYSQRILEGTLSIINRLIHTQYHEGIFANLILKDKNGKFDIGSTITADTSGISTEVLSSSYSRITVSNTKAKSMKEGETISDGNGNTATIEKIILGNDISPVTIQASDTYNDYVIRYRIINSSSGIYLSLLELYMSILYGLRKYVTEELGLSFGSKYVIVFPQSYTVTNDLENKLVKFTNSGGNLFYGYGSIRYIDYDKNSLYIMPYIGADYGVATHIVFLNNDYTVYDPSPRPISPSKGLIEALPIDIFNFYHGDIEIASEKDYDKIIEEYSQITSRPVAKDGLRANQIKKQNFDKYIEDHTINILNYHLFLEAFPVISEETILETFNPEIKNYIDELFSTGEPINGLIALFTEFVNWVMSNIRLDFPNIGAIMIGGEYLFKDIETILNFFKPMRARFIQGKADIAYLFNTPLFESIIVEDVGFIKEEFHAYDYLIMDSKPNYYDQNYVDGEPENKSGRLTDPYEFWDTGSYFDIGVVDDKDNYEMFENYGTIEYLACQREIFEQNRVLDNFTNANNTLLQDHTPTFYGGAWKPFTGSSNLHIYLNRVVDKTANEIPAYYYNTQSIGYNFRIRANVYGYSENGYGYLILRGRDFSGDPEYYAVKFQYFSATSKSVKIWIVQKFSGQSEEIIYGTNLNPFPITTSTFEIKAELINRKFKIYLNGSLIITYDLIQDTNVTEYIYGAGYGGIGLSTINSADYTVNGPHINEVEIDVLDAPMYNRYELDSTSGEVIYAIQATGWLDYDANQIFDCPWMNDVCEIILFKDNPVITSSPNHFVEVNTSYSYDVNAIDPLNRTLTYSLISSPSGMTINSSTGLISWNPTSSNIGKNYVTVEVRAAADSLTTQNYTLGVYDPNASYFLDEFNFHSSETTILEHVTETGHSWYTTTPNAFNLLSGSVSTDFGTLWVDKFNISTQNKYEIETTILSQYFSIIIASVNKTTTRITLSRKSFDPNNLIINVFHSGLPVYSATVLTNANEIFDSPGGHTLKIIFDRTSAPSISISIYIDGTFYGTYNLSDGNTSSFNSVGISNCHVSSFKLTRV
ncbi:MAG: hypothetical protein KatS3mg002_0288 [Candidatus Woesearchaeota archaeon]|nr:MAG: hypothetical protein KatS3mg002_0288 [Candidatus Woesearchaeota archaeon]